MKKGALLAVITVLIVLLGAQAAYALSGAIFTTNPDGTWVNGNTKYTQKEDVYLDGGPGPNAPVTAASLPPGDYYFQVTNPSGSKLLSQDPIESRRVTINQYGVISYVWPAPTLTKIGNKVWGTHDDNPDADYGQPPYNAKVVQLMPYDNTDNNGGVYKVWITPVLEYKEGLGKWGFIPSKSKTDNFKVKGSKIPPVINVKKFYDVNANGDWDTGEPELNWGVDITEPGFAVPTGFDTTPFNYIAWDAGVYKFTELIPDVDPGWEQTAVIVDGGDQPTTDPTAEVTVLGDSGETHTVVFGNVRKVCVEAQKFYDGDADTFWDTDEPPVPNFKFTITGTNIKGEAVNDTKYTDSEGKVEWCNLYAPWPGTDYTVTETPPGPKWVSTTGLSQQAKAEAGKVAYVEFGNYCTGSVGFYTKGYWHNKNGLLALTEADRDYVNGLDPYNDPTGYFSKGDEPFNGFFADGTPVEAAFNINENGQFSGEMAWAAGTWQSEISHFLVDPVSDGGQREQLAEQLLAFIFNVRHQSGVGASLIGPGGEIYPASDLISDAIGVWQDDAGDWAAMAGLLDWFNNHHADEGCPLTIICGEPCPITAPY